MERQKQSEHIFDAHAVCDMGDQDEEHFPKITTDESAAATDTGAFLKVRFCRCLGPRLGPRLSFFWRCNQHMCQAGPVHDCRVKGVTHFATNHHNTFAPNRNHLFATRNLRLLRERREPGEHPLIFFQKVPRRCRSCFCCPRLSLSSLPTSRLP